MTSAKELNAESDRQWADLEKLLRKVKDAPDEREMERLQEVFRVGFGRGAIAALQAVGKEGFPGNAVKVH